MGLAFYRDQKYLEAFLNFEKASHSLKGNPKLWYYLGLCVLHYNKQEQQRMQSELESDVYAKKFGYGNPSYERKQHQNQLKRIQLTNNGDHVAKLHRLIQANESEYLEKLKSVQNELNKNRHKQAGSNISKAQLKKSEKTALQAWTATNMPKDSL